MAEVDNDYTYNEVVSSGLGSLQCLGAEGYGRWGPQCVRLVPALARERARGLHPRLRRGVAFGFAAQVVGHFGLGCAAFRCTVRPAGLGGRLA